MAPDSKPRKPNWLLATALAWLIPGAGHVLLGRKVRGLVIFVAITVTFWSGVAIGGIMTVDRVYQPWWYAAQMMAGVNGLVSWNRQARIYDALEQDPDIQQMLKQRRATLRGPQGQVPPMEITAPAGGRPDDLQMQVDFKLQQAQGGSLAVADPAAGVARAYTGIAGMMNLLCIFDVLMLGLMGVWGEPRASEADDETSGEAKS